MNTRTPSEDAIDEAIQMGSLSRKLAIHFIESRHVAFRKFVIRMTPPQLVRVAIPATRDAWDEAFAGIEERIARMNHITAADMAVTINAKAD